MYGGGGQYDGAGGGAANANALFGGGGFMPSQSTAVPESSGSGLSKVRSAQTLLPLTVKQIMDAAQASDDKSNFAVNGVEVSTVRLVGRMLNKVERVTDVAFTLDDGTGRIDVNRWENESSDTKEMADVHDGNYVIVNGGLKGFQGKRHIVAYSVRRVTDFNDVTHHAETVQIDEPVLVFDLPSKIKEAFKPAYEKLNALQTSGGPQIALSTYFGDIVHNIDVVDSVLKNTYALHVDLVRNPEQLSTIIEHLGEKQILSAGVVDGRNIWKTNFKKAIEVVETAVQKLGKERVLVATSSSLLHTPHTLDSEKKLDEEVKDWFSFASQKVVEVAVIAKAVTEGPASVQEQIEANAKSMQSRATSKRTNNPDVKKRQDEVTKEMHSRKSPFDSRYAQQKEHLKLPQFPTTTIGSFPQTQDIRIQRNKFTKGEITPEEYEKFIEKEIQDVVAIQDELDLDVYVHGEPERNDMVQYFGERLDGYVFTTHAWVQSYGSRCVRPPIIVGDISRPAPMTVKESKYAASISKKPMKGMLTGPITCLRWSFPRDDVHQSVQAQQLALALRDEVVDLEAAGIYVIQVDEPALREGLPLRAGSEREKYLAWAVDSFKLSTAGVTDSTQIHSHFCYSEFQDFFHAISALDADVLSIENSKSDAKLLKVFIDEAYPRHIGPGVYDIHSPRVPSEQEIKDRLEEMLQYLKPDQLWVNPDCGLKTRQWKETKTALTNMVNAAKFFREKYSKSA